MAVSGTGPPTFLRVVRACAGTGRARGLARRRARRVPVRAVRARRARAAPRPDGADQSRARHRRYKVILLLLGDLAEVRSLSYLCRKFALSFFLDGPPNSSNSDSTIIAFSMSARPPITPDPTQKQGQTSAASVHGASQNGPRPGFRANLNQFWQRMDRP